MLAEHVKVTQTNPTTPRHLDGDAHSHDHASTTTPEPTRAPGRPAEIYIYIVSKRRGALWPCRL